MSSDNPLSEASPQSLEEIFSASPKERSLQEWEIIVTALCTQRAKWAQDEAAGLKSPAKKTSTAKKTKTVIDETTIDFED